jgi:hypothetical protein
VKSPNGLRDFVKLRPEVEAVLQHVGLRTWDLVLIDVTGLWVRDEFETEELAEAVCRELGSASNEVGTTRVSSAGWPRGTIGTPRTGSAGPCETRVWGVEGAASGILSSRNGAYHPEVGSRPLFLSKGSFGVREKRSAIWSGRSSRLPDWSCGKSPSASRAVAGSFG